MNQNASKHIYKNRRSSKKEYKRVYALSLLLVIVICFISILSHKTISSASTEAPCEKYYKSIEIQAGDSLWSIAQRYYTEDWEDINAFMEEIKSFNGIANDEIHSGNYLAIPYFTNK